MTDWLDVDDAASYLKVPTSYIRRLVLERRVRFHKLGKYLRFTGEDLDAVVRIRVVEPVPDVVFPLSRPRPEASRESPKPRSRMPARHGKSRRSRVTTEN